MTNPLDRDCQIGRNEPPDQPAAGAFTLYQLLVTQGCSTAPLEFCPSDTLQREDMAAFIVRSWSIRMSDGPEVFTSQAPISLPPGSPTSRPTRRSSHTFQKLYELGITSGYTAPVISGGYLVTQESFAPTRRTTVTARRSARTRGRSTTIRLPSSAHAPAL